MVVLPKQIVSMQWALRCFLGEEILADYSYEGKNEDTPRWYQKLKASRTQDGTKKP